MTATIPSEDHTPGDLLDQREGGGVDRFTLAEEAVRAQLAEMPRWMINSVLFLLLEKMRPAGHEAEVLTPVVWRALLGGRFDAHRRGGAQASMPDQLVIAGLEPPAPIVAVVNRGTRNAPPSAEPTTGHARCAGRGTACPRSRPTRWSTSGTVAATACPA